MCAVSKEAYIMPLVSEKAKCKEDGHFLFSVRNLSQSIHFPALDYAEALTRTQSGYVAPQVSAITNITKVELKPIIKGDTDIDLEDVDFNVGIIIDIQYRYRYRYKALRFLT